MVNIAELLEEVVAAKHEYMGREIAKLTEFENLSVDRLIEIAKAEKEGRLVVLPCAVGDTVYLPICGEIVEAALAELAAKESGADD